MGSLTALSSFIKPLAKFALDLGRATEMDKPSSLR
jgi:hypothetical protein